MSTSSAGPAAAVESDSGVVVELHEGSLIITGSDNADNVTVVADAGSDVVFSEFGVALADDTGCVQESFDSVRCSPSPSVTFRGYGGGDSFVSALLVPVDADGGDGSDTLEGNATGDKLVGGRGNDTLIGRGGPDLLSGQAGNDTLRGNAGPDNLIGGGGTHLCVGGRGADSLSGCER